jgi:hypothetical protein
MGSGDWTGDRGELAATAAAMAAAPVEVVVLDCMGHDDAFRRFFAARCPGKPVLLVQTATPPPHTHPSAGLGGRRGLRMGGQAQTVCAKVASELLLPPPEASL